MGLQFLWSFGLACIDVHALKFYKDLHNQIIMSLFVVGDWVTNSSLTSFLSLLPQEHAIITSIMGLKVLVNNPAAHIVKGDQLAKDEGSSDSFNQDLYKQFLAFARTQQPSSQSSNSAIQVEGTITTAPSHPIQPSDTHRQQPTTSPTDDTSYLSSPPHISDVLPDDNQHVTRKSCRQKQPPSYLADYHCNFPSTSTALQSSILLADPPISAGKPEKNSNKPETSNSGKTTSVDVVN
ncbi:unnamed protein product [Fraxinus pennsylvanica]|uniref:Uncharacterized protein n=1 Tax=Fraxinus pennsylvanica TaxID=56036 RepID=A0AAD1ZRP9_9LAMI|nr:unnamed protein product [Fraxinus pennsylvanica]